MTEGKKPEPIDGNGKEPEIKTPVQEPDKEAVKEIPKKEPVNLAECRNRG